VGHPCYSGASGTDGAFGVGGNGGQYEGGNNSGGGGGAGYFGGGGGGPWGGGAGGSNYTDPSASNVSVSIASLEDAPYISITFEYEPVVPEEPLLPATGGSVDGGILIAGMLMLAGAIVLSVRGRRATS